DLARDRRGGLVAAEVGLQLDVSADGVDDRPGHHRRARVVEVDPFGRARCVLPPAAKTLLQSPILGDSRHGGILGPAPIADAHRGRPWNTSAVRLGPPPKSSPESWRSALG